MRTQFYLLGVCALAIAACEKQEVDVLESTTTELGQSGGVARSADSLFALAVAPGVLSKNVSIVIETDRGTTFDRQTALVYRITPSEEISGRFELAVGSGQRSAVVELGDDGTPRELSSTYETDARRAVAVLSALRERSYSAWSALIFPMPCGDGTCTSTTGESCQTCELDCGACPQPTTCGDGTCTSTTGESCSTCSDDCGPCEGCGDGVCTTVTSTPTQGNETCLSCEEDCGPCEMPPCGNGICDVATSSSAPGENCAECPEDCGICPAVGCGDGICADTATVAETCSSCSLDCGTCTNTALRSVTAGRAHVCARGNDNIIWCMGENGRGQLGDGSRDERITMFPVTEAGAPFHAQKVSAGGDLTCAVRDQELYCWGALTSSTAGSVSPVLMESVQGPLPPIIEVDVGTHYVCAIDIFTEAWCAGESVGEDLVHVEGTDASIPSQLHTVSAGSNQRAAFVDGSGALYSVQGAIYHPSESLGLFGPIQTAVVGAGFECIETLTSTPTSAILNCWGENSRGQLGNGGTAPIAAREDATQVWRAIGPRMEEVLDLDLGLFHGCVMPYAPFAEGAVECWGAGTEGQLGNGLFFDMRVASPARKATAVDGFNSVYDVATGDTSTCVVDGAGRLWCTGLAGHYQLGHNGYMKRYSSP